MDRSDSKLATSFGGNTHANNQHLQLFDRTTYDYGTYINGFQWDIYGCGTYKSFTTREAASRLIHTYYDRLSRSMKAPLAQFSVLESRTSGCGLSPTPVHWHFVVAAPPQHRHALLLNSRSLWEVHHGNAKIDLYDGELPGAFYIAKTARRDNFDYDLAHLDRMAYTGPTDIYAHSQIDPYVPNHAKHLTFGQTLILR